MINPITTEAIVKTNVAAAEMSLIFLALTLYSNITTSMMFSIAVFNNSILIIIATSKTTIHQSVQLILLLRMIPRTITMVPMTK